MSDYDLDYGLDSVLEDYREVIPMSEERAINAIKNIQERAKVLNEVFKKGGKLEDRAVLSGHLLDEIFTLLIAQSFDPVGCLTLSRNNFHAERDPLPSVW